MLSGGSKWVSALPTGGSKWVSALPTGGSRWVSALPTGNAGMCFLGKPRKPENPAAPIYGGWVRVLFGGSKWLSALPTGSRWVQAQPA